MTVAALSTLFCLFTLSPSIVSAASPQAAATPSSQAAPTPQQPPVAGQSYRVDLPTGAVNRWRSRFDGKVHGEVVSGVNPKHVKDFGQSYLYRLREPLAPGEYALTSGARGMFTNCKTVTSAFTIVE